MESSNTEDLRAIFSYSGDHFFAKGDGFRGERYTVWELQAILQREHARGEDRNAQFYAAQLVHYGMKPMKTKGAIKKRLRAKLADGTLQVPDHIVKLEQELKAEDEAAKKAMKAAKILAKSTQSTTPVRRMKQSNGKSTDRQHEISEQADTAVASSSKLSPITVASTSPEPEAVSPPSHQKQTARMSTWPGHRAMFGDSAEEALQTLKHSREEMKKRIKRLSKADARGLLLELLETQPAVNKPLHKALFSREKVGGKRTGERLSQHDWAGVYYVTDRYLFEEEWNSGPHSTLGSCLA